MPILDYDSHLPYLPHEDLKVFWKAEVLSLPISQTEAGRPPFWEKMRKYQGKHWTP